MTPYLETYQRGFDNLEKIRTLFKRIEDLLGQAADGGVIEFSEQKLDQWSDCTLALVYVGYEGNAAYLRERPTYQPHVQHPLDKMGLHVRITRLDPNNQTAWEEYYHHANINNHFFRNTQLAIFYLLERAADSGELQKKMAPSGHPQDYWVAEAAQIKI